MKHASVNRGRARTSAVAATFSITLGLLSSVVGCEDRRETSFLPLPEVLFGAVEDPEGDAERSESIDVSPDLVGGTVEIDDGTLIATVAFAPGTLSRDATHVALVLDTDQDASTGFIIEGRDALLGWDYVVAGPYGEAMSATIARPGAPGRSVEVGTGTVTYPSEDEIELSAPMELLGHDDGHLFFRIAAAQIQPEPPWFQSDYMPELERAPGFLRTMPDSTPDEGDMEQ